MLCVSKIPNDLSGVNDDVESINISVFGNNMSLTCSNVPTVPAEFKYTLILEISPVSGSKSEICINANDSEFCVGVY